MAIAIWFGQRTLRALPEVILLAVLVIFCYLNPVLACPGHSVRAEQENKTFAIRDALSQLDADFLRLLPTNV